MFNVTNCFVHCYMHSSDLNNEVTLYGDKHSNNSSSPKMKNQVLSRSNFFLWRQKLKISSFLLRVAMWGLVIIKYFSRVHREQIPVTGVNGLALPTILHFSVYFTFSLFNLLIWLLKVVDVFLCLIDVMWLLYLNLNSVAVSPTYVSTDGGTCSLVTSAW